jgi:hypothetical protein
MTSLLEDTTKTIALKEDAIVSIAISLKRIADALEALAEQLHPPYDANDDIIEED